MTIRPTPLLSRALGSRFAGAIVLLLGGTFCAGAVAWNSAVLERSLLGSADGRLAWGPTLFRALLAFHGMALAAWGIRLLLRKPCPARILATSGSINEGCGRYGWWWTGLVAICALGLGLRLWRIDSCLWFDELMTFVDFLQRPMREIVAIFPSQNQHMLYSVLGRVSVVLLGENAGAARLPAALFGVASIWALYLLGRQTNGRREALLACLLMCVSYHHVWFSQNARGYTALLFFTTLATAQFLHAIRGGGSATWAAYAASVALGLWAHMTMLFAVGAHGLVWLAMLARRWMGARLEGRGAFSVASDGKATLPEAAHGGPAPLPCSLWKALPAWLFAATITLQLHALSLPEFLRSALHEESKESEWTSPWWVMTESLARLGDAGLAAFPIAGGLLVLGLGLAHIARKDAAAAALMVLPALLGGGTMIALGHNLWPRFFFFCMGFFLLMAAAGATASAKLALRVLQVRRADERTAATVGSVLTLLVILASATTLRRCYWPPKQDFTGAREFVESQRAKDEPVVAVGLAGVAYSRYFAPHWRTTESAAELGRMRETGGAPWLVYTLPIQLEGWHPDIWDVVRREFDIVKVFPGTLGDGDVYVCRPRPAPEAAPGPP